MNKAYLLLGGNIGDRLKNFEIAIAEITKKIGNVVQQSSIYETAPWGFAHEQNFLNQVIEVSTNKKPLEVLSDILEIEKSMGRVRSEMQFSERTIDIDILFYNDEIIHQKELVIPHPRIQDRRFTLVPMNEIAAKMLHPVYQKTNSQLLNECKDELEVKRFI